jgi:hypothetical protein
VICVICVMQCSVLSNSSPADIRFGLISPCTRPTRLFIPIFIAPELDIPVAIDSHPKEFVVFVCGGQITRPLPLNRMLFAHSGIMESLVAANRAMISSLVSWNQSLTRTTGAPRSAAEISASSEETFVISPYGRATSGAGCINRGPRRPSWYRPRT